MKASELAKILLENPDVEVTVRISDDDIHFDVLSSDENIILLVDIHSIIVKYSVLELCPKYLRNKIWIS